MSNHSIFKKLDDLCTKVTVAIIGDIPHDGQNHETSSTQSQQTTSDQKNFGIKNTLSSAKAKLLNLGKPADEKALLYEEVIKKERTHTSQEENIAVNSASPKTKTASSKKPASSTAKKTSAKQAANTTVGKTDTKKPTTKKSSSKETTTKKTATSNKSTTASSTKKPSAKKPVAKKPVAKKSSVEKASIEIASSPSKKAAPATNKKAEAKTTSKTKSETKKKSAVKKTTVVKKATSSTTASAKTTTSKKPSTKTASSKKTTSAKAKVGKRDEKIALYAKHIKKYYGEVDKEFLTIVVKNLGPSIYKKNAEMISCSDPKELKTVRKNFLVKKLGIDASDGVLNAAIQDVCEELKASRTKYRATFYYALAKKFKKESVLS